VKKRYFFHVSDGSNTIYDENGSFLSGPEVTLLQAAIIAAELAQDGDSYKGYVVHVTDERGKEIGQVPVIAATT
jgi:hypothetical protein